MSELLAGDKAARGLRQVAPDGGEVRVHALGRWPRPVMSRDLTGLGVGFRKGQDGSDGSARC
jgi:hypothetical protein